MILCGIGFQPVVFFGEFDRLEAYPKSFHHSLGAKGDNEIRRSSLRSAAADSWRLVSELEHTQCRGLTLEWTPDVRAAANDETVRGCGGIERPGLVAFESDRLGGEQRGAKARERHRNPQQVSHRRLESCVVKRGKDFMSEWDRSRQQFVDEAGWSMPRRPLSGTPKRSRRVPAASSSVRYRFDSVQCCLAP